MAAVFNIPGPTVISWCNTSTGSSFTTIGYTSNDQMVSILIRNQSHLCKSTHYGEIPREIVNVGGDGRVSGVFAEFDEAEIASIRAQIPGNSGEGTAGTVGGVWVGADFSSPSKTFQIKIAPTISGQKAYTFPACYLDENSLRLFDFGNVEKKVAFDIPFTALNGSTLYTVATVGS